MLDLVKVALSTMTKFVKTVCAAEQSVLEDLKA